MTKPARVTRWLSSERESPKSMITAWPWGVTMMLSGFRSRWMTFAVCAAASASSTWRTMGMAFPQRQHRFSRSTRPRGLPSMYSMET